MNVYGKIDEKQEESHYQDWSVPEKREGAPIPFFSIMLWSLVLQPFRLSCLLFLV